MTVLCQIDILSSLKQATKGQYREIPRSQQFTRRLVIAPT